MRVYWNINLLEKVPCMENFFQVTNGIAQELFDLYESFKLKEISSCRFTQAEMLKWFHPFESQKVVGRSFLGKSGEGREISLYSIGSGGIKVMLWSQMHGDEPTATMAIADTFGFFANCPNHSVAQTIQEKLTLLMIPMLNPDGAERFTRRTAQLIDINRDAQALETPEARILKTTRDKYKPEYGFNLHDQDTRLTVGATKKITAIALLAPAIDESRGDNVVRLRAKRTASTMVRVLNQFIPGHLAKWDDSFEPRAFGDSIQKWGTSTVLVESGGWKGDPDKFFLRKLNCIGLLSTLYAIAIGENEKSDIAVYEQIPFNMKLGCDYIIRNAAYKANNSTSPICIDVGINFEKRKNPATGNLEDIAAIVDVGDLSTHTALEKEENAAGAELDETMIVLDNPFPITKLAMLLRRRQ
jgi:hypothetical protein